MERKIRTYKIENKPYEKAKKRAKGKLATKIEMWVTAYGKGEPFTIIPNEGIVGFTNKNIKQ